MRTALACLVLLATSGRTPHGEPGGEPEALPTVADRLLSEPPVSAELIYRSPRSTLGWGNFDLSADPDYDEIHVNLLLGTPAQRRHWHRCTSLHIEADGRHWRVPTRYAGVPMRRGVFDAVSAKLNILHVREMATALQVHADLCGERVTFDAEAQHRLQDFVKSFDALGIYDGPSLPEPPPELGPEHEWDDPAPMVYKIEA